MAANPKRKVVKGKAKSVHRIIATAGAHGSSVSIVPRLDYPFQAQAQWTHPKTRKRVRRSVSGFVLPTDGSELRRVDATTLERLAISLHDLLTDGRPMPGESGGPTWERLLEAARKAKSTDSDVVQSDLSVREALAIAYGSSYAEHVNAKGRISGKHVRRIKDKDSGGAAVPTWTSHARDLRRLADVIEDILGPSAPWTWSESTYTRLQNTLIQRIRAEQEILDAPRKLRRVFKVLQVYIRATRLVAKAFEERPISPRPKPLVKERWKVDLESAWTAAGLLLPDEQAPRYTLEEAAKIYVEGTNGRHDPRYALWLELGGLEGRPRQLLRSRRSHLDDDCPETPCGVFRGPGKRLKHGLTYAPTPAHAMVIRRYLARGYLREYERRYQAGEIADYPLFLAGKLDPYSVLPFSKHPRPLGYRQFLGDARAGTGFYEIERASGVSNAPGRGPYGLKYAMADLAPVVAGPMGIADAVVINLATAHDTPGTAPRYRLKVRKQPRILVAVGRLLWGMRKELRRRGSHASIHNLAGKPTEAERIADFVIEEGGVRLRVEPPGVLWVPWSALGLAGTPKASVSLLEWKAEARENHEVDDDARVITFPQANASLRLEVLLQRARDNEDRLPHDAVELPLSSWVW